MEVDNGGLVFLFKRRTVTIPLSTSTSSLHLLHISPPSQHNGLVFLFEGSVLSQHRDQHTANLFR